MIKVGERTCCSGKLPLPRSWPLGHRITFMTYTMQRCTQEQSAGKCHLIRFVVSQHFSHFHSHSHQWLRCPRLAHLLISSHKKPNFVNHLSLHPLSFIQRKEAKKTVEDFQISIVFNLFQTSTSKAKHAPMDPHRSTSHLPPHPPSPPLTASSALEASENVINPNPRDSPLSRSLMSCTLMSPHLRNASRTSSWFTELKKARGKGP